MRADKRKDRERKRRDRPHSSSRDLLLLDGGSRPCPAHWLVKREKTLRAGLSYSLETTAGGVVSSFRLYFFTLSGIELTSLDDLCDLGGQRLVDQAVDVKAADAVDEAKVQVAEVERRKVEAVEQAELGQLQHHLQLLELKKVLQAELALLEQALERQDVEVVDRAKLGQELQIQTVDDIQVLEVLVLEAEVVELREVERSPGLDVLSGRSSGNGGQSADDDAGGLHFEGGWGSLKTRKIIKIKRVDRKQRAQLGSLAFLF